MHLANRMLRVRFISRAKSDSHRSTSLLNLIGCWRATVSPIREHIDRMFCLASSNLTELIPGLRTFQKLRKTDLKAVMKTVKKMME